MTQIQTNVEWLVPMIQSLTLEWAKIQSEINAKEYQLSMIPEVLKLQEELLLLKGKLRDTQIKEADLREKGKQIMLDNDMKEVKMLDGTVVSLHFTPWALVVEDGADIPDSFYKEKVTIDLDKTSLKKAITDGTFSNDKVYIKKDCKFVIKTI